MGIGYQLSGYVVLAITAGVLGVETDDLQQRVTNLEQKADVFDNFMKSEYHGIFTQLKNNEQE